MAPIQLLTRRTVPYCARVVRQDRQSTRRAASAACETIALDIARADMHYLVTSIVDLPSSDAAAEVALVQYGAMAAYEAQLHFDKTLGVRLSAKWEYETAKASRMSGKFFADTARNLDGVVAHFADLLAANRGAFFPLDRRGRILDFLRDDLAVVILDGQPYTSLVSAHYLSGLTPEQVGNFAAVSAGMLEFSTRIGNVAGALLHESGIGSHRHGPIPSFEWFDGKSTVALPCLFGGELDPPLAAALLTVQSMLMSAVRSTYRVQCRWCEVAARKHRFVALYQALTALDILRRDGVQPSRSTEAMDLLDDPEFLWVLRQSKLRNGMVHLGLQDISSSVRPGHTANDVIRIYSGEEPDAFDNRVTAQLGQLVDVLTRWMLSPTDDGRSFLAALHPAP